MFRCGATHLHTHFHRSSCQSSLLSRSVTTRPAFQDYVNAHGVIFFSGQDESLHPLTREPFFCPTVPYQSSVDLNVLAPVLAELRNSGGGSIGGTQFPTLPFPNSNGHSNHHTYHPFHQPAPPYQSQDTHRDGSGSDARGRQDQVLQEQQQQLHQQQHPQRQQRQHHRGSSFSSTMGPLPVVTEPGTPPHILSDDAASNNGPSPREVTPHSATSSAPTTAAAAAAAAAMALAKDGGGRRGGGDGGGAGGMDVSTGGDDGAAGSSGGSGANPNSREHSSASMGATAKGGDASGGGGGQQGARRRSSGGPPGAAELSIARVYAQFYGPPPPDSMDDGHESERLPPLLYMDSRRPQEVGLS